MYTIAKEVGEEDMPQLSSGGGDDLGANDEMIAFKDEGEQEEKIQENAFTERDLADLKSSLVNESEINQSPNAAVGGIVCVSGYTLTQKECVIKACFILGYTRLTINSVTLKNRYELPSGQQ